MLKRHQVLLEDWQVEYLQTLADVYDVSLSEALRVILSLGTLYVIYLINPEYKLKYSKEELGRMIKRSSSPSISTDEKHAYISKLYFEARKVTEYRIAKLKAKKK